MGFRYEGRVAADDDLGLEISDDVTWRGGDGPWVKVVDRLGAGRFAFPLSTETRVVDHPDWSAKPWPAPAAYRLSRPSLTPYLALVADHRTRLRQAMSAEDLAEAFRQGMFVYCSRGGYFLKFVPDLEVTWVDTQCPVSTDVR